MGSGELSDSLFEPRLEDVRRTCVRAFLSNNPYCVCHWRDASTSQVTSREFFPTLMIDVADLPNDGDYKVRVSGHGSDELSFEAVLPATNRRIRHSWNLHEPILSPDELIVNVEVTQEKFAFEQQIALRIFSMSGRVTDFDGRPIKAAVVANGVPGIATHTDENGHYQLWLPDRHIPELLAYDDGYGITTLECWVYNYHPQEDITLDMRIGQLELYELQAWRGYTGIKADFLPMSVSAVGAYLKDRTKPLVYCPELSLSDISLEMNGTPLEILSMNRRSEIIPAPGITTPRDEYAIQAAKPPDQQEKPTSTPQVLRVTIQRQYPETSIIERGEAFYLGL